MVIKRSKKPELPKKKIIKEVKTKKEDEEGSLSKRIRERKEREAKEKEEKKKAEEEAKKEEERKHKLIRKYMEKLDIKLKESGAYEFWVWCDRSDFKKMKMAGRDGVEEMLKKDINKYIGRKIANIVIQTRHKEYGIKTFLIDPEAWIRSHIIVFKIDKTAKVTQKTQHKSFNWEWHTDDFKISKPTFKLLEWLMYVVADNNFSAGGIQGTTLEHLLDYLKNKKNIKIPKDVFQPLAGI